MDRIALAVKIMRDAIQSESTVSKDTTEVNNTAIQKSVIGVIVYYYQPTLSHTEFNKCLGRMRFSSAFVGLLESQDTIMAIPDKVFYLLGN